MHTKITEVESWSKQPNHHILRLADKHYPKLLREIADPPPVLYVKGSIEVLNDCQIAMVGCRHMSHYGKQIAYEFAKSLADLGIVITSGLAMGIDSQSHLGALAQGKTIAVLGCGLEQIYSSSNYKLANQIAENGALVSEFPLTMPANKRTFPKRNRIISGMSIATLIIEAAIKSGSLITARLALEQNRTVLAVPGSIFSPQSKGCHHLIKQGATAVESIFDILLELKYELKDLTKTAIKDLQAPNMHDIHVKKLPKHYAEILQQFGSDRLSFDHLVEHTSLTPEQLSSMLLIMELDGFIRQVPGGYIRTK